MDKVNVLEEGVWELEKLRDQLVSLAGYKEKLREFDNIEQKMEQELHAKNVQIADEINIVVSRREHEVSATFDEQIDRQNGKIKKIKEKKEKNKNQKVKERIASETATLVDENKKLSEEVSYLFRDGKVSRVFNNRFFFALLAPKGIGDIIIDIIVVLVSLLALPKLLFLIVGPKNHILFNIVTYVLIIIVLAAIYYLAYNGTKLKNPDVMEKAKGLRYRMRQNQREINKIKRRITKDKDESGYDLQGYDKEIHKIEQKICDISKEKNDALATLKNSTSNALANEVRAKYQEEMDGLQVQYQEQKDKIHKLEEQIGEITGSLTNDYQAYLGKDMMNVETIDSLINIMNGNNLRVISEAVQMYRVQQNQGNSVQS